MSTATRRAREKDAKRRAILVAAIRCFGRKGYDATSLDDVRRDADVAKGTLYLYFRNKADLFASLILEHGFDVFTDSLDTYLRATRDARSALHAFAACFRDLCLGERKEIFELFLQLDRGDISRDLSPDLRDETRRRLKEVLERMARLIDAGRAREELYSPSGSRIALVLWALCVGVAHVGRMGLDAKQVLHDGLQSLLKGIEHDRHGGRAYSDSVPMARRARGRTVPRALAR